MDYIFENNRRYAVEKGEKVLVGNSTLKARSTFIERKTNEYKLNHPEVSLHYAKRQARMRWYRIVNNEYKRRSHAVH